jgi:hypothetical protein
VSYDQLKTRIPAVKNHADFTGTRMERVKQKGVVPQEVCAHPKRKWRFVKAASLGFFQNMLIAYSLSAFTSNGPHSTVGR